MRFRLASILLCTVLFSPSLCVADFDFIPRAVAFPVGSSSTAVAMGDLNGDGRNDVALVAYDTAGWGRRGLFVFLQSESGYLNGPINYSNNNYNSVDIGDLNHDGTPDVVAGYGGVHIEVFPQTASGTLGPSVVYPTPNSYIVRIADMNNDGRVDVVGLGMGSGVSILLQTPEGTLQAPVTYPIDSGNALSELKLAVGDINNDGLIDIVTQSRDGSGTYRLVARLQKRDGTFDDPIYYVLGQDGTFAITVGDIDGDGLNELIAGVRTNLFIFHNVTQAGFAQPDVLPLGITGISGLSVTDITGDGRNDVVFLCNPSDTPGVCFCAQTDSGTLLAPAYYPVSNSWPVPWPITYLDGGPLAIGDLNGDGLPDVAFPSDIFGLVAVYHMPRAPAISFSPFPVSLAAGDSATQTIQIGNVGSTALTIDAITTGGADAGQFGISGDTCSRRSLPPWTYCTLNVSLASLSPSALTRHAQSDGGKEAYLLVTSNDPLRSQMRVPLYGNVPFHDLFQPYTVFPTTGYPYSCPEAVAVGDLNGDGRNDVALLSSRDSLGSKGIPDPSGNDPVFVYLQDPSGNLLPPVTYTTSGNPHGGARSLDVGDVTGDGRADVVVGTRDHNDIQIFVQNPSGTLNPPLVYPSQNAYCVAIGDFNRDGRLDIVGVDWGFDGNIMRYETAELFLQSASGAIGSFGSYYAPYAGYNHVTSVDINARNQTGIVVMSGQFSCPEISILTQKGDGTPQLQYYVSDYGSTYGVAVGDVNGDGLEDIVFTYRGISRIGLLLQHPDGTFGPEIAYDCSADYPEAVQVADVNGDGRRDIVVAHGAGTFPGDTRLGVFLQSADGLLMPEEIYNLPYATHINPQGLKVADINGDGIADVIVSDYNHGLVVLYGKKLSSQAPVIIAFDGAIRAYNNRNTEKLMSFVSASYLNGGDTRDRLQEKIVNQFATSFDPISYTITGVTVAGDFATLLWTSGSGQPNSVTLKSENGSWKLYGDQQKYGVTADAIREEYDHSGHPWGHYLLRVAVNDPSHTASSVIIAGLGVTGTTSLTYRADSRQWELDPRIDLGAVPPASADYTITVTDLTGQSTYARTVSSWVREYASNLSPAGTVSGNIVFNFTGLQGGACYAVQLFDLHWNRVWASPDALGCTTATTIPYSGPELPFGQYYCQVTSSAGGGSSSTWRQIDYLGGASCLALSSGWNFLSLPKIPLNSDIETILADVSTSVRIAWGWDNRNQVWTKWTPTGGTSNAMSSMESGKGYWIYMDRAGGINMIGWETPSISTVHLYDGWNLVGFLGTDNTDISEALSNIAGRWGVIWGWTNGTWRAKQEAATAVPVPPLSTLNQGRAYWIKVKQGQATDWTQ